MSAYRLVNPFVRLVS